MNKIEKLINELCPEGVEFLQLWKIAEVGTGNSNWNESVENWEYPFFVRSKNIKFLNTFQFNEEAIVIPWEWGVGDIFHYINGKYALHQRAYRIHFHNKNINTRFAYFYLFSSFKVFINKHAVSATVKSIRKPMIEKFPIPVPPLPIQEEIVKILDTFTQLGDELESELEERKKQYEYYREEMLSFNSEIEFKNLWDIVVNLWSWKNRIKSQEWTYPVFGSTWIIGFSESYKYNYTQLLIARVWAYAWKVNIVNWEYDVSDNTLIIDVKKEYSLKYLFYFLVMENLNKYAKWWWQPLITWKQLKRLKIPIPPLKEQQRIVGILDEFDKIVNDSEVGLPAEIEARRKQYEYYREKLLSFKELKK